MKEKEKSVLTELLEWIDQHEFSGERNGYFTSLLVNSNDLKSKVKELLKKEDKQIKAAFFSGLGVCGAGVGILAVKEILKIGETES